MDSSWGNERGGYLGEAPRAAGFGRKTAPVGSHGGNGFTLSNAAAPVREVHEASSDIVNDVDFSIGGGDLQFVEIELDPGEAVVAEPGAMIWKDSAVVFDTTLGDGSNRHAGLGGKLLNAGMNLMAGENMFVAEFRHGGSQGKARAAFGGRVPGHIIPVRLEEMGGSLICQRHSFLVAAKGVKISVALQRRLASTLFGEEGFIMQRLTGQGWVFLHVGGSIIERQLAAGETIQVDGGCVAAHEPQVDMDIDTSNSIGRGLKNYMVGGESLFLTTLRGPGKVWLQTLPFSRLAAETAAAAPAAAVSAASLVSGDTIIDGIDALRKMF